MQSARVRLCGDSFSGAEVARLGCANYMVPKDELADFTEKFAHRMAHMDNETLMCWKPAVNRQYETQGSIRDRLHSGTEIQTLSAQRNAASEWSRRVREDGLGWRDGPFRDLRDAYASAPKERAVADKGRHGPGQGGTGYGD